MTEPSFKPEPTNDMLRDSIRSNEVWLERTRADNSLTEAKKALMIEGLEKSIRDARSELLRRERSGESRKYEKPDPAGNILMISVVIYAAVILVSILLAPITGGRSLAAIGIVLVVIFIHGLIYAMFS